ncbi:MAG: hypothetical protein KCHDKBKB_02045 [Elusimicrobia bacterium]|nr:hypothetical protein [Elusimicrobiota bacterium]
MKRSIGLMLMFTLIMGGSINKLRADENDIPGMAIAGDNETAPMRTVNGTIKVVWGAVEGDEIPKGNTIGGPATKTPISVIVEVDSKSFPVFGRTNEPGGEFSFDLQVPDGWGDVHVQVVRIVSFTAYTCIFSLPLGMGDQDFGETSCNLRKS